MKKILIAAMITVFIILLYTIIPWAENTDEKQTNMSLYKKMKAEEAEKRNDRKKTPGSFRYLKLFNSVRSYPEDNIPENVYDKALIAHRTIPKVKGVQEWTAIGPKNIGGRTLDIAIDPGYPNILYAASASGGLWKNTQGGMEENAWTRLDLGYPGLAVAAVEIDPVNTDTIYAGTGEIYGNTESYPGVSNRVTRGMYGIGILRSADGGITWQKSLDWSYSAKKGVQRIKIDPSDHNTVWAATTEGVYRSDNAGESWILLLDVPMATDLIIFPDSTDVVIAGCGGMWSEGHGIYRSADRGVTWNKKTVTNGPTTFGGKIRLDYSRSSPEIVFASIGYSDGENYGSTWLCKSIDHGNTWSVQNTTNYSDYQGWYSHYVAVHPENPDTLFLGGIDMFRSNNGGVSLIGSNGPISDVFNPDWLHSDHHDIEFHPDNPSIIYFAHDGGVHITTDGGRSFTSCNWGYQTSQFYNGFSCSETDSLFAMGGLQDNYTCIYDGNAYWRRVIGGDGSCSAISQSDNNIIFGSWQYLNILKSTDKGYNFNINATPATVGNVNFIAPFLLSTIDNMTMYAGEQYVHKSIDQGSTWTPMRPLTGSGGNPVIAMDISRQNVIKAYAATSPGDSTAKVYFSREKDNWSEIRTGLPDRHPTDIAVDPLNDNIAYITYGGFGTDHLFRTENSGETWEPVGSGLPDLPGWSVIVDPFNTSNIYYGNDFGVYFSPDAGSTWQSFSEGLGDGVVAMDLKISYSDMSIKLATHGNGAFERKLMSGSTGIVESNNAPAVLKLEQNYPNPFNSETRITFTLESDQKIVELAIFNVAGEKIKTLTRGRLNKGKHSFSFNATGLNSGVYFYTLSVDGRTVSKKMNYIK